MVDDKISTERRLTTMEQKLDNLCENVEDGFNRIQNRLDRFEKQFVLRSEFIPIRNIIYGMVGAVLTAFLAYVIRLVFG